MVDYPDNVNVLKIENSNGLEYYAYPLRPSNINQDKPTTSISLPGQGPRENIHLGVQGMQRTVNINFYIWEDGEDRSNGTHSEPVVTVGEQIEYLMEYFHDPSFDVNWTIEQDNSYDSKVLTEFDAHLENIRVPIFQPDNVKWVEAVMQFEVGGV